jgi:hypothetical protein
MDLVLEKVKIWFFANKGKNMFRIRKGGVTKSEIFTCIEELNNDQSWEKFLTMWEVMGEGDYEIDLKGSERAGWTTSTTVTKVTPSSNAIHNAINGIGSTNTNMNGQFNNSTFEYLTQQLSIANQKTDLTEAKYQSERDKVHSLEREIDKLKLTKKKKKDPMKQLLKPEFVKEVVAGIGFLKGTPIPVAQIGTVTHEKPVDATLPDGEEVMEQSVKDAIRQQRWATSVAMTCHNLQAITGIDIKTLLETLEEKAAENPADFTNKLNMAMSYL